MSALLEQAGLARELPGQSGPDYPKPVEGRVAHIDADFLAYQVSAESKDELAGIKERKTLDDMRHNALNAAVHIQRLAAATSFVLHTTPSGSTKGGRDQQAFHREYQANRKARTYRPEHLDAIRDYMGRDLPGIAHMDQEADDGMAQAAYNASDPYKVIICSKDKDLCMVPGLHLDMYSESIVHVRDRFGGIAVDDSKSSKKVIGRGTKFFWAQCLMGDSADNIKGLPAVVGKDWLACAPTKAYEELSINIDIKFTAGFCVQKELNKKVRMEEAAKPKPCGPVLAYALLKDCKTDLECYRRVRYLWCSLEQSGHVFEHWQTTERVSATRMLASEMQLLWMRRSKDPKDVFKWLKEQLPSPAA